MTLPTTEQAERRLAQVLAADSAQTGEHARTDRLMLMLTRDCELRCSYCLVDLSPEGAGTDFAGAYRQGRPVGDMSLATGVAAVEHLFSSPKPRLGLQFFGGEPTRRWDRVVALVDYARAHPLRRGRELELQLTTNGLGLGDERLDWLAARGVVVQLSVDGLGRDNRFRRPPAGVDLWAIVSRLRDSAARWFLNITVPPAGAGELPARYARVRQAGVPAVQLNYATGLPYTPEQQRAYLDGLATVLATDARSPGATALLNWQNAADPAPLCGDVICDVDGTLLQVGGIFHEKRFPSLYEAYRRGRLGEGLGFSASRSTLGQLAARTEAVLSPGDWAVFRQGMWLGAASDIVSRLALRARP